MTNVGSNRCGTGMGALNRKPTAMNTDPAMRVFEASATSAQPSCTSKLPASARGPGAAGRQSTGRHPGDPRARRVMLRGRWLPREQIDERLAALAADAR
jgi:hypothetical protein